MALSFRTETFQDTLNEITDKVQSGELEEKDIDSYIKKKGLSVEEFISAEEDYLSAIDAGETDIRGLQFSDSDISFVPDKLVESAARTTGRFLGETGRGVINLGDALLPEEVTAVVSSAAETVGAYVPTYIKKAANEFFDPYHGEGLLAGGEELVGTLGSYIAPGGLLIKGANLGIKGSKALSSASRALSNKAAKTMELAGKGGRGVAYAAGATMVENPQENIVNILREEFPDSTEFLERLSVDPNDSEAEQYVQALLNNIGVGSVFAPIALAATFKKPIVENATKLFKPIGDIAGGLITLPKLQGVPARIAANLTSRRGTDDTTLGLMVENSNAAKAALIRAEGLSKDLKQAVNKAYGKETDELVDLMNKALEGDSFSMSSLDGNVRDILLEMRQNITNLSKQAGRGATGELKSKINKNLDTYVTRNYDLFDDPAYARQMNKNWKEYKRTGADPKGVFAAAIKALDDAGIKSPEEQWNTIGKLINKEDTAGVFDSLLGYTGGLTSAKSGLKRSEKLPQGIRDMLGEVKDPYKNYVNTFSNLSQITAQQKYLTDIAQHLKSKGLATGNETLYNTAQLDNIVDSKLGNIFGSGAVKQMDNPLEGLYVTPQYKKAIEEGLELMAPANELSKVFMRAKGLTQTAQTVFSPVTHGRNVMGNTILMVANGMLPGTKLKDATRAIMPKGVTTKLLNKSNKELADKYARYVELGIANSGLAVNLVRRNLAAFDSAPEKWLTKAAKPVTKLNKKVTDLYQAEDDFFKIAHFEKTLDYIKKSKKYGDLPLKEQERIAAQRTRDLMPNYNLVPKVVKSLRGAPFGDFISFPAEMTRISKNLAKYTLQDLTSGDPALFAEGAKRAAGLTAAGIAGDSIADMSMALAGISKEQDEAINNLVPSWEYNQNRIYLSGIDEDKRGHAGVDYVNLGPIDPFSYLKVMGKGMHELIASGDVGEEKSAAELQRLAIGTIDSIAGPFTSPSIITKALMDTVDGKRIKEEGGPSLSGKVFAAVSPLVEVVTPKIIDLAMKRSEYEKSREKYGDYAIKPNSLATWPEGEVDLAANLGIKRQRLDLTAGTKYALNNVIQEINGAGSNLNSFINKNPNLTEEDTDKIVDLYLDAQDVKAAEYERLQSLLESYDVLYGDRADELLNKGLSLDNNQTIPATTENHITNARQNYFEPYEMPITDMQVEGLRSPIPYDTLDEIYRAYDGALISK